MYERGASNQNDFGGSIKKSTALSNPFYSVGYNEGREQKEIAAIMNRNQRAIRQRLYIIREGRMKAIAKQKKAQSTVAAMRIAQ